MFYVFLWIKTGTRTRSVRPATMTENKNLICMKWCFIGTLLWVQVNIFLLELVFSARFGPFSRAQQYHAVLPADKSLATLTSCTNTATTLNTHIHALFFSLSQIQLFPSPWTSSLFQQHTFNPLLSVQLGWTSLINVLSRLVLQTFTVVLIRWHVRYVV